MTCVIAGVTFDSTQRFLKVGDKKRHLEPKVFNLLTTLIKAKGALVTREQLIVDVWNDRIVGESAINRTVSLLRGHFSVFTDEDIVETVPTQGYRLIATLSTEAAETELQDVETKSGWLAALNAKVMLAALIIMSVLVSIFYVVKKTPVVENIPSLSLVHGPLIGLKGWEYNMSASRDGKRILFHHLDEENHQRVYLYEAQSHKKTELFSYTVAAISPNGKRVVYANNDQQCHISVMELATKQSKQLMTCENELPASIGWGNNENIYFNKRLSKSHPYQVFSYHIETSHLQQVSNPASDSNTRGDFTMAAQYTGDKVAVLRYVTENKTAILLYEGQQLITQWSVPKKLQNIAWHPDNKQLVVADEHVVYLVANNGELQTMQQVTHNINSLAVFGYAQKANLLIGTSRLVSEIMAFDVKTKEQKIWQQSGQLELLPRVQRDRKLVLSTRFKNHQWWQIIDNTAHLIDITLPFELKFARYELSTDGQRMLFTKKGIIYEVNIDTQQYTQLFELPNKSFVANYSASNEQDIIYSSNHTGQWQLWHYQRATGQHKQLTEAGGYSGWEWQGYLYYSKFSVDGLWRKALNSDTEELVIEDFDRINWLNWRIIDNNLYFYRPDSGVWQLNLLSNQEQLVMKRATGFVHQYTVSPAQDIIYWVKRLPAEGDIYQYRFSLNQ